MYRTSVLDFNPGVEVTSPDQASSQCGYPFPLADFFQVLGVLIGRFLHLDEQHVTILSKARARQSTLSGLAGPSWALELGTLKITYDSVVVSLLRCAGWVLSPHAPSSKNRHASDRHIHWRYVRRRSYNTHRRHAFSGGYAVFQQYVYNALS